MIFLLLFITLISTSISLYFLLSVSPSIFSHYLCFTSLNFNYCFILFDFADFCWLFPAYEVLWYSVSEWNDLRVFWLSRTLVSLMSSNEWLHFSDPAPPQPQWSVGSVVHLGPWWSLGVAGLEAVGSTVCLWAAWTGTGPADTTNTH